MPLLTLKSVLFAFCLIASLGVSAQPDPEGSVNMLDAKGRKQGQWVKKDSAGHVIYEGSFKDNLPMGEFKYFFPSGKLRSTLTYSAASVQVKNVSYYESGVRMAEGCYVNQKKDGLWKYFNDLGDLASEENYSKGVATGIWKVYYQGMKVMEEFTYRNGKKEGSWKQYFPSGNLKAEAMYIDDQRQGPAKFYFTDGSIMTRGNYRNDLKNGIWENYKQNGQKESVREFDNGNMISETYYDKVREQELFQESPEIRK